MPLLYRDAANPQISPMTPPPIATMQPSRAILSLLNFSQIFIAALIFLEATPPFINNVL